jgi:outer membrane usher protein
VGRVKQGDRTDPEILAGLTIGLGHHTTADVQLQRSAGQDGVRAEIRKSLGTANGLGYSLQTDSLTDTHSSTVQYQTSFGRYEIAADPQHLRDATGSISGGLVYIGGALIPTRPLKDSFALARVGVPNVRVFASNQEIGRTNRRGDLLVTSLLAHYANELHIADKDIPMDYEVGDTNVTVVPPTRGGVLANFPVKLLQSFAGRVQMIIIGEPFPPSLGLVDVNAAGETMTLPLGREGEFYVENISPGTYPAQLNIGVVTCKFNLVIPSTEAAFTDLGVISCVP